MQRKESDRRSPSGCDGIRMADCLMNDRRHVPAYHTPPPANGLPKASCAYRHLTIVPMTCKVSLLSYLFLLLLEFCLFLLVEV